MQCAHGEALTAVAGAARSGRAGVSAASGPSGRSGSGSNAKLLLGAAAASAVAALAAAALPPGARSPYAGAGAAVVRGSRSYRSDMLIIMLRVRSGSSFKAGPPPCPSTAWAPAARSPRAGAATSSAF